MDFQLPGRKGDEVIAAIREEFPEARIVLLSIYETEENLWRAVEAGALGCVSKAAEINEVIAAVREVARGFPFYSEGLEELLAKRRVREPLTPRELEALELVVKGFSNKEIEPLMKLSGSTVKYHLTNVFAKLGVEDRTQAATEAVKRGIVGLE
jgi:DNA-binding NarL/FixJ family response regulator